MEDRHFNTSRLRTSTGSDKRSNNQLFESDRGRVLFSAPFRRLQSKAQVFSLESNAAVRSRLTHTMEVAHVGRYISQQILDLAKENNEQSFSEQCKMIIPIVETACLLHDIGNPPFGHLGENAIQEWFRENTMSIFHTSTSNKLSETNPYYLDLLNFDGNPQGARIILTLQGYPGKKGLNLTSAQIGALIKYPRLSPDKSGKYKKIAVFTSEKESIQKVWDDLNIEWGNRHPLVYIMEAADDIAYSLSDIEDGIEKGIITEKQVFDFLEENFDNYSDDIKGCIPNIESPNGIVNRFVSFRTSMINLLTKRSADFFYENRKNINNFKSIFDKEKGDDYSLALNSINQFCLKHLYKSKEAEDIEIAGYNIVYGLLEKFSLLLKLNESDFRNLIEDGKGKALARRMYSKIPKSLVGHYIEAVDNNPKDEWFIRSQMIVDYISGMTDDFALQIHKLLNGIEIKVI